MIEAESQAAASAEVASPPTIQSQASPGNQGRSPVIGHVDWLRTVVSVSGPAEAIAAFRTAAAGAGVVPWIIDYAQVEEDLFLRLLAAPPEQRGISVAGARILAGQLRAAAERRQRIATLRIGHSKACPIDLHALVPVPPDICALGPNHPESLAWLTKHWGTTAELRRVAELLPPNRDAPPAMVVEFWSIDWTPWSALSVVQVRWPDLRFDARPDYGTE